MYTGGPKGPFWDQKSPNKASMPMSQIGLKWSKWYQMMNITCFSSFGTILGPFGLFVIISDKTWFFASKTQSAFWPKWFGAKNQVLSEMIPKGSNRSKMALNDQKHVILVIWDNFGPSQTTLGHWQACHVWPFLAPKGPFWAPLRTWLKDGNGQNCFKPTLYMAKDYACATDA